MIAGDWVQWLWRSLAILNAPKSVFSFYLTFELWRCIRILGSICFTQSLSLLPLIIYGFFFCANTWVDHNCVYNDTNMQNILLNAQNKGALSLMTRILIQMVIWMALQTQSYLHFYPISFSIWEVSVRTTLHITICLSWGLLYKVIILYWVGESTHAITLHE